MRGDEWNRLVGEPSVLDVDAALAEVRVRAVPIARRSARNKRAVSLLVGVLAIGGAFAGGRAYANGGVRVGEEFSIPSNWNGMPTLVAAGDATRPVPVLPAVGPTVQRFHVTSWTQWDDERFGDGEAWVEGPPGVSLAFRSGFLENTFDGQIIALSTREGTHYQGWSNVSREFGASPRGLPLTEHGWANISLTVPRGQPVLLYPFGRGGWGEPTTVVRIEGPDLPAPANVRWELPEPTYQFQAGLYGYSNVDEREAARMRSAGIRVATVRSSGLHVVALLREAPTVARFSLAGRSDTAETMLGNGRQPFEVPGIPGKLVAWRSTQRNGEVNVICIHVHRTSDAAQADRRAGREPLRADGCMPFASRFTPFETLTNQGQRLRIKLVAIPGVNY